MPIFDYTQNSTGITSYTAGDGISIQGNSISAKVSVEEDNATQIYNGAIYTPVVKPTAMKPQLIIYTAPSSPNIDVVIQKAETKLTLQTNENGAVTVDIPLFGTWDISATLDGEKVTNQVAISTVRQYIVTLSSGAVCGVAWDMANPSTKLTRLTINNDPYSYVTTNVTEDPSPAIGIIGGTSPFDRIAPWSEIYECNLDGNGTEIYKRGEPGFSRTEHETMVWIPKFYYRVSDAGSIRFFYISSMPLEGFERHPGSGTYIGRYNTTPGYKSISGIQPLRGATRPTIRTNSRAKGTGWDGYDYMTWCAAWLLYLVEFADWDSQNTIGLGYTSGRSAPLNNGGTDNMIYHTGRASGTDGDTAIQYRWIENLWGNLYQVIDGINVYEGTFLICTNPENYADDTGINYVSTSMPGVSISGYISKTGLFEGATWAFIPTEAGGSQSSYIPDRVVISSGQSWRIAVVGNHYNNNYNTGLFDIYCGYNSASEADSNGARLIFRRQEVQA